MNLRMRYKRFLKSSFAKYTGYLTLTITIIIFFYAMSTVKKDIAQQLDTFIYENELEEADTLHSERAGIFYNRGREPLNDRSSVGGYIDTIPNIYAFRVYAQHNSCSPNLLADIIKTMYETPLENELLSIAAIHVDANKRNYISFHTKGDSVPEIVTLLQKRQCLGRIIYYPINKYSFPLPK